MAHFAQIDENSVVVNVIVAEPDKIQQGFFGDPNRWKQTSYNTMAGQHLQGGIPLRKNYAGIGYTYDSQRDAFIPPRPFPSWILDEQTCLWQAPIAPDHAGQTWNESTLSWS